MKNTLTSALLGAMAVLALTACEADVDYWNGTAVIDGVVFPLSEGYISQSDILIDARGHESGEYIIDLYHDGWQSDIHVRMALNSPDIDFLTDMHYDYCPESYSPGDCSYARIEYNGFVLSDDNCRIGCVDVCYSHGRYSVDFDFEYATGPWSVCYVTGDYAPLR